MVITSKIALVLLRLPDARDREGLSETSAASPDLSRWRRPWSLYQRADGRQYSSHITAPLPLVEGRDAEKSERTPDPGAGASFLLPSSMVKLPEEECRLHESQTHQHRAVQASSEKRRSDSPPSFLSSLRAESSKSPLPCSPLRVAAHLISSLPALLEHQSTEEGGGAAPSLGRFVRGLHRSCSHERERGKRRISYLQPPRAARARKNKRGPATRVPSPKVASSGGKSSFPDQVSRGGDDDDGGHLQPPLAP